MIPGTKEKNGCGGIHIWSMGKEDYNPARMK